jgi:replicative DNA helicase
MTSAYERNNPIEFAITPACPPQNLEAEEAILGGILLDPVAMSRIADLLIAEAFYVPCHQEIYRAALALHSQGIPTDLMNVTTWLNDRGQLESVGGTLKLVQLVDRTVSAVNIDALAHLINDKYVRRQIIQAGNQIARLGYESATDLHECLEEAERLVYAIGSSHHQQDYGAFPIGDALMELYVLWEEGHSPPVLPTGLYDLDALIGGLRQGDLAVVAGRPSMGKTQLSLYLAYQAAVVQKLPVVFFSAEMSREKILCRLTAMASGVDASRLLNHKIGDGEWEQLARSLGILSACPLRLDCHPNPSLSHMRTQLQRTKSELGELGLVVLDYLQLLGGGDSTNRVQELDALAKGCKALAKEFEVPFLALSQLNRGVEGRNNKRPLISDLRESGAIEQTADLILLLYRDEYYDPNTPDRGLIEIAVGKNRDGSTGVAKFLFDPKVSGFKNLAR